MLNTKGFSDSHYLYFYIEKKMRYFFILLLSMTVMSAKVQAGPIPNFGQEVTITAVEQPIAVFLQELFGQIGIPVVVDPRILGNINGSFNKKPTEQVFKEVASSFGLTSYYDGAVLYIYTANDLSQKILAVPPHVAHSAIRSAGDLGLVDEKNYLQSARAGGLVISGTKRFIQQIEELVAAAQSNLNDYKSPLSFGVFYLKYAWAQDVSFRFGGREVVVPGIASILSFLVEDGSVASFASGMATDYFPSTMEGLKGQGLAASGVQGRLGLNDVPSKDPIRWMNHRGESWNQQSEVRIGVDPRLNAVIVRDSPERMGYYEDLIKALDVEPQMVEIEATIIDINTSKLKELGINWRSINSDVELLLGRGDASDLALRPGQSITPLGQGGFASFVLGSKERFFGRINALVKEGAAKIVSRPQILTLSNVEAIFDTSSTFFVRVAGEEEVDLFNISVGTSLRVTPHVFKDDEQEKIKLLVSIDDGRQEAQQVDNIPVVTRSVINTQALINADESVLIGGLVREATVNGETRVPLLSDIPIVGNLFKSNSKEAERVERMFLISPRLSVRGVASQEELEEKLGAIDKKPELNLQDYFQAKNKPQPKYPNKAKKLRIEGYCTVEYTIKKTGRTSDIDVVDCPNDVFAKPTIKAVEKTKYIARLNEKEMMDLPKVRVRAKFVFNLDDRKMAQLSEG